MHKLHYIHSVIYRESNTIWNLPTLQRTPSLLQSYTNLDIRNSTTKVPVNFLTLWTRQFFCSQSFNRVPKRTEQPNYGNRNVPVLPAQHHQPYNHLCRTASNTRIPTSSAGSLPTPTTQLTAHAIRFGLACQHVVRRTYEWNNLTSCYLQSFNVTFYIN